MEIKPRFSGTQYLLISIGVFAILLVLVELGYVSSFGLFLAFTVFIANNARQGTSAVAIDAEGITIVTNRFFIKKTICHPIDNISLEIIYSGSTGRPEDAILNVFEGTKCIYQVYASHGFTEDEFKKLIIAFNDLKPAIKI